MKKNKHDDEIAISVNGELAFVNPYDEIEETDEKKKKFWQRKRKNIIRHRASEQICYVVDNEYICVDKY